MEIARLIDVEIRRVEKRFLVSVKGKYFKSFKVQKTKKEALKVIEEIKCETSLPLRFSITKLAVWPYRVRDDQNRA